MYHQERPLSFYNKRSFDPESRLNFNNPSGIGNPFKRTIDFDS